MKVIYNHSVDRTEKIMVLAIETKCALFPTVRLYRLRLNRNELYTVPALAFSIVICHHLLTARLNHANRIAQHGLPSSTNANGERLDGRNENPFVVGPATRNIIGMNWIPSIIRSFI